MKVAFLDLDGTLINSSLRHKLVLEDVLRDNQVSYSDISDYLEYKRSGKSTKKYLLEKLNLTEQETSGICSEWGKRIEEEIYLKNDILYEETTSFLAFLKHEEYKIYFLTARKNENFIKEFVKSSELYNYGQLFVVNPQNAASEKSEIIKKYKEEKTIVVGDTEVDFGAAKENEVSSFMLNRGFRNSQFWKDRGVCSYDTLQDIMKTLGEKTVR